MNAIARQFENLQRQYPQVNFSLGNYFGFEAEIYTALNERVLSLLNDQQQHMMECDGYHYRQIAQEHGNGHQH